MKKLIFVFSILFAFVACEDDAANPDPNPDPEVESKITFDITEANMVVNEVRAFVVMFDAEVTEKIVTWAVEPASTGGTIYEDPEHNNVGIYEAPEQAGVYKVVVMLVTDTTQKAHLEITVSEEAIEDEEIFYNGNISGVQSGPTNPTEFSVDRERILTKVSNYHYFNGGVFPGTISLQHSDGTIYGPWQTYGSVGQGGVVNAVWNCYPLVKIKAGTYTVIDSDPPTWSHNSGSNYCGFTWIRAIK